MPARNVPFLLLGPTLLVSWPALALLHPRGSGGVVGHIAIGYLLGTLFGQTTLAAAWTAFGPGPWRWRLVFAPLWVLTLWVSFALNMLVDGPGDWIILVIGCCLIGQWILVLLPFAGLAVGYSLQVEHRSHVALRDTADQRPRQLQFGIRQLLILTASVAVILGCLRALVTYVIAQGGNSGLGEATIFIFLAVAAVVMTVPLVMALLLPRWWIAATTLVLALLALATFWELPLFSLLPRTPGPDTWHFVFINAFTAGWIVLVLTVLRIGGYELASANFGLATLRERRARERRAATIASS